MTASIFASPPMPRVVVRPALATLLLHGLMLYLLTVNLSCSERATVQVKPAPQVIHAQLVEASALRPQPAPAPAQVKPPPAPPPKPAVQPAPQPAPKAAPEPAPQPAPPAKPEPAPKAEPEAQSQRMTAAELAALAWAELNQTLAAEEQARAAATAGEMAASFANLIQKTVIGYWSRPPSARNGMEVLLQIQLIPTGEVVSVQVLESSGNAAFDRSAINAVDKAGAFPELRKLPAAEFEKSFRRFRLLFRPEDLRY